MLRALHPQPETPLTRVELFAVGQALVMLDLSLLLDMEAASELADDELAGELASGIAAGERYGLSVIVEWS